MLKMRFNPAQLSVVMLSGAGYLSLNNAISKAVHPQRPAS
jgi:hypothetical protein